MVDSMSIGGLDKYFLQAYNSPNYYQLAAQSQAQATPTATPSVAFKGKEGSSDTSTSTENTKGGNGKAWAIIGTVATVGAAALCHRAGAIKGVNGFWNKMGKGAKEIGENAFKKDFWKKMWQGLPEGTKNISRFSATIDDAGEIAYIIPGKTITKSADEALEYATKYGIDVNDLAITPKTENAFSMFKKFNLTTESGDVIKYQGDEIIKIIPNGRGAITEKAKIKEFLDSAENANTKTEINAAITKLKGNNFDGININDIEYQITRGDDVFTMLQKSMNNTESTIKELKTLERFSKDSDEVKAYFFDNPAEKEIFEKLTGDSIPEAMKTISRQVEVDGVTYQVKDGMIEYLVKGGKRCYAGKNEFKACFKDMNELDEITKKCNETTGRLPKGTIISIK